MRFVRLGVLMAVLACGAAPGAFFQDTTQPQPAKPKDQIFSGKVEAIDDASLTVTRTVLGKESTTQKFTITEQTRFEGGKPKVSSRVTVRYITTEDGDLAIHIILRTAAGKK
jgi:hypothetical protein